MSYKVLKAVQKLCVCYIDNIPICVIGILRMSMTLSITMACTDKEVREVVQCTVM